MKTVRLARRAMATRFELVLQGTDEVQLRAAGEEALAEISRLEAQLSFYRPTSDVSRINARAATEPVRVEPRLFKLLQTAQRLSEETDGAFDITVGPLMRCWGFVNGTGQLPDQAALAEARRRTGMHLVTLHEANYTVSFSRPGVQVDLGGIGKGYALDEAAEILREVGVMNAFLHGGTSTIVAMGQPFDAAHWKVAVPYPEAQGDSTDDILAIVPLHNEALSVSAVAGKSFFVDGKEFGHVLDPRKGKPVDGAEVAAVVASSATETDAISTALLVMGQEGQDWTSRYSAEMRSLVVFRKEKVNEVIQNGLDIYAGTPNEEGLTAL